MATEAQVSANRANAQKSTGPRTPEGKAAVAQNAVKHGLRARAAVLQGEDWEEYTCFRAGMLEELYPDGLQERELADRIVSLSWRLRRAARYQDAVFEALYDKPAAEAEELSARAEPETSIPSDPVLGRMLLADFSGDRVLERVLLYERRIENSLSRARAELRQLRREPQMAVKREAAERVGARASRFSELTLDPRPLTPGFLCETNPIHPDIGLLPREELVGQAPPYAEEVGRGRPTYEEPPCDPMNRTETLVRSCETKPIAEEVSRLKCQVSRGQGQAGTPANPATSNLGSQTHNSAFGGPCTREIAAQPQACETNPISRPGSKLGNSRGIGGVPRPNLFERVFHAL